MVSEGACLWDPDTVLGPTFTVSPRGCQSGVGPPTGRGVTLPPRAWHELPGRAWGAFMPSWASAAELSW